MVKQQCSGRPLSSTTSQPKPVVDWEGNDGNESVDSLEACLGTSNSPSDDDRDTFEKMEQVLRDAEGVPKTNEVDRLSPSNGSMRSDVGKFFDMRSNPNPVSRYSACGNKQMEDVIDRLTTTKTHALSTGTETEDETLDLTTLGSGTLHSGNDPFKRYFPDGKQKQSKDEISRALFEANESSTRSDDDDYVANMVADVKRRRSRKEVQQTYWQTYDSADREVDGESTTVYVDDESTLTGTFYSEDEDGSLDDYSMCELLEKQRRKKNQMGNVLGLMENCTFELCLGGVEGKVPKQSVKKRCVQSKKSRRKSCRRGVARDAPEDATVEDTALSGYNREDATLAGTLLSSSTKGGTLMSGSYTAEYEMPAEREKHPPLLSEPKFLAEDDGEEHNELVSDKAFAMIHNVCSSSWFRGSGDGSGYKIFTKSSFQSKDEGATVKKRDTSAIESEVVAFTVKERLDRTRSQQLVVTKRVDAIITKDVVKGSEDLRRNKTTLIRTPSQDELRAIYESMSSEMGTKPSSILTKAKSFSKTASSFRRQTMSKLATPSTEANSNEDEKEGAFTNNAASASATIETSYQRQQNELNMMRCEMTEKPPTKKVRSVSALQQPTKAFLPQLLFSFKRNKKGPNKTTTTASSSAIVNASSTPASPARTAISTGTSDTSIESRSYDDDVLTSYAALALTRTGSRVLISI